MDEVILELFSTDPWRQVAATKRFRDLIHREDPSLPLDPLVFDRGVVQRLVTFIKRNELPPLQVGNAFNASPRLPLILSVPCALGAR